MKKKNTLRHQRKRPKSTFGHRTDSVIPTAFSQIISTVAMRVRINDKVISLTVWIFVKNGTLPSGIDRANLIIDSSNILTESDSQRHLKWSALKIYVSINFDCQRILELTAG